MLRRSLGRPGQLLASCLLASLLVGCDAFEYYGPLPNLRHALTVNLNELGKLQSLQIRKTTLSSEASRELRLVNTLHSVELEDCQIADGRVLLESLGEITRLESLTLRRCNLTDDDLVGLAAAENLRELKLMSTNITGNGLAALSKLPLRSLVLHSSEATAETLSCLSEFESLEEISLSTPRLAVNELPDLGKLQKLRSLAILNGQFSANKDEALHFLRNVPTLREVRLSADTVTDSTMHGLGQLSTLERIEISRNGITDQGIDALQGLSQLKTLRIWGAERLTAACLPSLLKHQQLQELSLSGAPIHHSDARVLDALPQLAERDVGMSRWEIASSTRPPRSNASYRDHAGLGRQQAGLGRTFPGEQQVN